MASLPLLDTGTMVESIVDDPREKPGVGIVLGNDVDTELGVVFYRVFWLDLCCVCGMPDNQVSLADTYIPSTDKPTDERIPPC